MKKIIIYFPILAILLLAACSNAPKMKISPSPKAPVLSAPSQSTTAYNADSNAFVLNLDSTGIADNFICTPADYGRPTQVTYSLQIDRTGDNFMHPQTLAASTSDTISVTVQQLYLMITGDTLNAPVGKQTSFDFRVMTTIGVGLIPTYSNTVSVKIDPLPALTTYDLVSHINLWYLIGLNGKWNYSASGIGNSLIPLSLVSGKAYNKAGDGTFTYTGYFQASQIFKIVSGAPSDMGTWANQWGSTDGGLTPVYKDGSSSNFSVPADGYYTITLNSIKNTLSIVPATSTPSAGFSSMGLIGDMPNSNWSTDINMTPCEPQLGSNNHMWYIQSYTFGSNAASGGGCKFRADASWNSNWGNTMFPDGLGTSGGSNIMYMAGTYTVIFNDINGCYYFIAQ